MNAANKKHGEKLEKIKNIVGLFGYEVSNAGLEKDVDKAVDIIKKGDSGHYMACANPHSLIEAESDSEFSTALHQADILLPDGAGIILAAKVLGLPIRERVAGNEFFIALNEKSKKEKIRYFWLQ